MAPPTDSPAVEAVGLGRRFGRHWALAHVDLKVDQGETVLLAGANGSGKSTLLRLIAGLYTPTSGSVRILGTALAEDRLTCRRALSTVSHANYLYDRLNAVETLRIWSRLAGKTVADSDLGDWLEEMELSQHSDVPVGGFSAGMKKRLTLLRTRLENPQIVLLDEPFSALDAAGKRLVERWIDDFKRRGITLLMASHALSRAPRLCSRAILLEQGQIAWQGPASEVTRQMEVTQ